MSRQNLLIAGLVVSFAVNLFLLGGIATRLNNLRGFEQTRPFPPNIGWIIRDLDEARQQELVEFLEPLGDEALPLRRAMFQVQRRVSEIMRAPEYDQAALEAAFAELRQASGNYTSLSHQQTVLILNELTEEERTAATEFVQRRGPRDGRDGFRGSGFRRPGFNSPSGADNRRFPDADRPATDAGNPPAPDPNE